MGHVENNKGTPSEDTNAKNGINPDNEFNKTSDNIEFVPPNPSIATPGIPQEMPVIEYK